MNVTRERKKLLLLLLVLVAFIVAGCGYEPRIAGQKELPDLDVNGPAMVEHEDKVESDEQDSFEKREERHDETDVVPDEHKNIGMIAASSTHSVRLKPDGTVAAVGDNNAGQCNVTDWKDIVAIDASYGNTIGIKADGTLVVAGIVKKHEYRLSQWKDIIDVASRDDCVVGVSRNGAIYVEGSFGDSNVSDWTDIVQVCFGQYHIAGLKSDGTVLTEGFSEGFAVDTSTWTDIVEISAGDYHVVGLKSDGSVVAAAYSIDYAGSCDVEFWTHIESVSAGGTFTFGVKTDGTVVSTGGYDDVGTYDQGMVHDWTNIVAVSAGTEHTLGLKSDGSVVVVGYQGSGQCDVEDWNSVSSVIAGHDWTAGIREDGSLVVTGRIDTLLLDTVENAALIDKDVGPSVVLKKDGTVGDYAPNLWTNVETWDNIIDLCYYKGIIFGLSSSGYLIAAYEQRPEELEGWTDLVAVSSNSRLIAGLKSDGTVVAAGEEYEGAGTPDVSAWTDIIEVDVGQNHIVGLKSDGTVVAASSKPYSSSEYELDLWKNIVAISASYNHTVGLKADGTVICSCLDSYERGYRCEIGDWTDIVGISAGWNHTVGLKSDGTVVAVGEYNGDLCNIDALQLRPQLIHVEEQLMPEVEASEQKPGDQPLPDEAEDSSSASISMSFLLQFEQEPELTEEVLPYMGIWALEGTTPEGMPDHIAVFTNGEIVRYGHGMLERGRWANDKSGELAVMIDKRYQLDRNSEWQNIDGEFYLSYEWHEGTDTISFTSLSSPDDLLPGMLWRADSGEDYKECSNTLMQLYHIGNEKWIAQMEANYESSLLAQMFMELETTLYEQLCAVLPETNAVALVAAEEEWLAQREQQVEEVREGWRGGSGEPLIVAVENLHLTSARIEELLQLMPTDTPSGMIEKPLQQEATNPFFGLWSLNTKDAPPMGTIERVAFFPSGDYVCSGVGVMEFGSWTLDQYGELVAETSERHLMDENGEWVCTDEQFMVSYMWDTSSDTIWVTSSSDVNRDPQFGIYQPDVSAEAYVANLLTLDELTILVYEDFLNMRRLNEQSERLGIMCFWLKEILVDQIVATLPEEKADAFRAAEYEWLVQVDAQLQAEKELHEEPLAPMAVNAKFYDLSFTRITELLPLIDDAS